MKTKSILRSRLALCASALLVTSAAKAQSTWDGSEDGFWSTAGNWDTAPSTGDDLIFDGTTNQTNSNDGAFLLSINSLTLINDGWGINLGALDIYSGGITANGSSSLTGDLSLIDAQAWTNTTGTLSIFGTVNNVLGLTIGGAGDTQINSAITGAGSLTKQGAGTLTLQSTNSYVGQTTVSNGTLNALATDALGTGANLLVSGGTLDIDNFDNTVGTVTLTSGSITGTTGILTGTSFAVENGSISAILGGSGATLTKTTGSTVTLSGANSYTGTTAVSAGTLRLTNTAAIASSPVVNMATGTTLELRKDDTGGVFTNTRLNPVGTVTFNADRISSGSGQTLTLGGTVVYVSSGASTINFTGANSYNVGVNGMYFNASGNQAFTLAPTTANAIIGAIRVVTNTTNPDGWGTGTTGNVTLVLGGTSTGNTIASITELSGAAQQLIITKNTAATWTVTGNIATGSGNGHTISAGTLTLNGTFSANAGSDRKITLSGGTLNYNNAGAISLTAATLAGGGGLTITGGSIDNTSTNAITTSTFNPVMQWNGDWTFIGSNGANSDLNLGTGAVGVAAMRQVTVSNAATTLTVGGIVSNNGGAGGGITKAGAGTLELSGINTFTGGITVNGGTLKLSNANTFTGPIKVNAGTLLLTNPLALQNSVLDTTGASVVTLSGTSTPTFGGLSGATGNLASVISNYSTVTGLTLNPQAGFSANYGGVISDGSGATSLTKTGTGKQVLSGSNTYTGVTNINAGTLTVASAEDANVSGPLGKQLANAAGTIVFGGGTLQYSTANNFDYSGRFSTAAGQAIKVDTNGQTVTWATDLSSSGGSVTNTGPGTLTLSGTNSLGTLSNPGAGTLAITGSTTLSGATTVNAGTLNLGGGTANGSLSTTALNLAGGTFSYTRTSGATQAFTATNVNAGASTVTAVAGSTVTLGTLTPAAGGSVNFGTTGTITTSRANDATGILGGWATFGGTNWAVGNGAGSAITGFSGTYTQTSVILNAGASYNAVNISVDSTQSPDAVITPNTLRFNTAGAYTLNLTGSNNTVAGIMVNSAVGNNASIITGGTSLRGANNGSLSIIQNNTSNTLTIGTAIVNNGTSGLSKSGAGTVIITANATYTGPTGIGAGTLQLGNGGTTGTISSSSTIVNNGHLFVNHNTNQTLAAITGTGSVTFAGLTSATPSVLTLNSGNSFSGGFTLTSGQIALPASGTFNGFGTGLLTIDGGQMRTPSTSSIAVIIPNDILWNGSVAIGRASAGQPIYTFNGNITIGTAGAGTTGIGVVEPVAVVFNGNIGDNNNGYGLNLTYTSTGGGFTFNGQNTFTGPLNTNGKTLFIGGSGYLGGGSYGGTLSSGAAAFTYSSSANQTLSGGITIGSLTKNTSNTSTLTISGTTNN